MNRFAYLDSIRGFAALAVIVFHASREFIDRKIPLGPVETAAFFLFNEITDLGKIAVVLFFMVSGFVVPFSLLKDRGSRQNTTATFLITRIARPYPAYWLSIAGALFIGRTLGGADFGIAAIATNLLMIQSFVGQPNIQGLYWTLQIELVFYALCLGLFLFGKLQSLRVIFLCFIGFLGFAAAMGAVRAATGQPLPVALPLALAVMMFGLIWRFARIEGIIAARRVAGWMITLLVLCLPLITFLAYATEPGAFPAWLRYCLTYYVALLLFIALTTTVRIQSHATAYLGAISYSVYLFGALVQFTLQTLVPEFRQPGYPASLLIAATIVMTILLSIVVYRYVELPAITAGRRLSRWIDERRPHKPIIDSI